MTNLQAALDYGRPVFPVVRTADGRKVPVTAHGYKDATTDAATITAWWTANPSALVAMPTGALTGIVVLDVDCKNGVWGWDSLEEMGVNLTPHTWHSHTPSGGSHIFFSHPGFETRNSAGRIGAGLDIRGDGGSIILPAPVGGYAWDAHLHPDLVPLARMPEWLIEATRPKPVERPQMAKPAYEQPGLSAYGRASLDGAGRDIIAAPAGAQETTLVGRCYWVGRLVGGGEIPHDLARDALAYAAARMPAYDPHRPWNPDDLAKKVIDAINAGAKKPAAPKKERAHA